MKLLLWSEKSQRIKAHSYRRMRPLGNKRAGDSSVGTEGLQIQAVATARVGVFFNTRIGNSA